MSSEGFEISDNDIAIVGLAGRFPKSPDVRTFWENLRQGVECIERFGDEALRERGVDSKLLQHPGYVKAGGLLEGLDQFDAGFFGFGPKDAAILDPQLRHFIELCWEALEQAGHVPSGFAGSVGVFAGCGMNGYFMRNILTNPELVESTGLFLLRHTGNDRDFLPTTVSYKLNLTGPSVSVQTACSTSLVAVHFACQSLLAGECDMALAGGSTIDAELAKGYLYRENEVLAPDGHCRAFDAKAAGTVLASGAGVVVLRRLADALEDGDFVHAVIRGSAINNDGSRKIGYLAPSVDGQAAVVAEALAVAGLSAEHISYVEAHGTGTHVGDPIEVSALTQAFRQSTDRTQFCALGSVKPNIGHTDTAAGVANLIKVVEALKHRELPPSINYERPNPNIDFASSPFYVNAELRPWNPPDGKPRLAGVSSLGVGGTNAHVVVQEAPAAQPSSPPRACEVLPLSAKTASALDTLSERLATYLETEGADLNFSDIAHTLQVGRDRHEHRRVLAAATAEEAAALLRSQDAKRVFSARTTASAASVVFMFPGGGAQYPNMGRALYESEPVFREAVDKCLEQVRPHLDFDLRALLFPADVTDPRAHAALARPSACLPAIFAINYASAKLWESWGVTPVTMTGHSLGEYNAAHSAGVMSLEDALRLVSLRGRLVDSMYDRKAGSMLSVALPEAAVRELIGDAFDLAASNAPELCVVSGTSEDIETLEAKLREREVECRRLRIPAAGHSRLLDPILDEFRQGLASIRFQAPASPYITNLTGTWVTPEQAQDPEHWVRHLRQSVLFSKGLSTVLEAPDRVLLEVGPGQTLSSLARQQPNRPRAAIASLPHPEDGTPDDRYFHTSFGRLWSAGVDVRWAERRASDERRRRLPLPTYPFEHQRYWIAPGKSLSAAAGSEHVLQRHERVEDWFYERRWQRAELSVSSSTDRLVWLVFVDGAGLGASFVTELEARGHRVISVRVGDAFYRFNDNEFALAPEAGLEGYTALLRELAANDSLPDRIAHFWLVTVDETARPGSSFFHRNEEQGFYSLLFLAQALGEEDVRKPMHLCAVSSGMQSVGEERVQYPEKAGVLGPLKVIPTELPHVSTQSIDVRLPDVRRGGTVWGRELEALSVQLTRDVGPEQADATVAYRDGQRFVEVIERVSTRRSSGVSRLEPDGVYLVTGGLGGIGLVVARHLAKQHCAKLVLIGRSPLPQRADWDGWLASHGSMDPTSHRLRAVLEMEASGAEVMYEAADVANVEAMEDVLQRARDRFQKIDGVFHVAGAVDDGALQTKSQASMVQVFAPKVHGTLVLDKLLASQNLDFFVLFSSTSTLLGPAGQVDYVAANAFLNAFARSRASAKPYTLAINWGVWRDVGLGAVAYQRLGGAETAGRPVPHPMLDQRLADASDRSAIFATDWTVKGHWVLDDHRTDAGVALLPGTGYLALAHAASAELFESEQVEIRNALFVAPLQVRDDETVEMRLRLSPEDEGHAFEIESRVRGSAEWQLHAQGNVMASVEATEAPRLDLAAIRGRCLSVDEAPPGGRLKTSQEAHLRFGARWRCLRQVASGAGEALAEIELLPEHVRDVDDYPLHPALLDVATGLGLPLIEGYAGEQLYAPMTYERVRVLDRLPAKFVSHVRSAPGNRADKEVARFDVTITDTEGRVLVEVERFTVRRLADKAALGADTRRGAARLQAQEATGSQRVTPAERLFQESYELGIGPVDGMQALERALTGSMPQDLIVSSVDLPVLVQRYRAVREAEPSSSTQFERPELATSYLAPRDDIERKLAEMWSELLGVAQVGIQDDFFELGGHSLIAVRLFARIKKAWDVEYSLSILFDAPNIERLAELLREELGLELGEGGGEVKAARPRYRFLVNLQKGDPDRPPFFLVAGMFGNVLNLRHLATHLGADQPVWALQARGLLGDDEPHETFEEAARDYLAEVATVQPKGPYFVGGFSGGGITAFEMAQQLLARGERVAALVMLDSLPAEMPEMDAVDKVMLHVRKLQRQGPQYVRAWAKNRLQWEMERWRARLGKAPTRDYTPAEFRSEKIEQAFRSALGRYQAQVYPGRLSLFRPTHDDAYDLGRGHIINEDRNFIDHENRWGPYVAGGIDVHVVGGDHDGMVLEPHVRALAAKLRSVLEQAQAAATGDETAPTNGSGANGAVPAGSGFSGPGTEGQGAIQAKGRAALLQD